MSVHDCACRSDEIRQIVLNGSRDAVRHEVTSLVGRSGFTILGSSHAGFILPSRPTHPKLRSLLDFWHAKRGARRMPARGDLDVLELREWLGNLHLVEVIGGGRDFVHRVYGTELAIAFGMDLTGKGMSAIPKDEREQVGRDYAEVCRSGDPLLVLDDPMVRSALQRVEKLILPLSQDGRTIDRLLIGAFAVAMTRTRPETVTQHPKKARVARQKVEVPADISEHRRASRVAVRWQAVVEIGGDRRSCTVVDYSRDGAKLEIDCPAAGAELVRITLGRRGTRRAKVVWQREGEMGIEFLHRRRGKSSLRMPT